jgi:transposase
MRSVGLDLGARHITYCEVVEGKVTGRGSVRRFSELASLLGPDTSEARVAFEACREGWHVHDTLLRWGKEPFMLDTTRIRQIGVGQHRRKNDAIDAEVQAMALDAGRVPLAHVLSPERRALRAKLSVRQALVETRAGYVTTIRGLARAKGVLLPSCKTTNFLKQLEQANLDQDTRDVIAPLIATLEVVNVEIAKVEVELSKLAQSDEDICRWASD